MVTSEVRFRTFSSPGQNVPESVQGVMLATVANVPFGKLYPGAMDEHAATLLPDAAFVVPEGQLSTTALAL
jgi:hypothetical protein